MVRRIRVMNNAIVIISFDGYQDVWNTFFECFEKNWNVINYNVYFVSNHLEASTNCDVKFIQTGDEISWSRRVRNAIEKIPEENLLILLEDYFISEVVNDEDLDNLFALFENNKCDYLRIVPIPKLYTKRDRGVYDIGDEALYGVNLQASIWSKEFLTKLTYNDDFSAWEFEARQKVDSPIRVEGKIMTLNYWGIVYLNGIIQGKWFPETIKKLDKIGVVVDADKRGTIKKRVIINNKFRHYLLHHVPMPIIKISKPILVKLGVKFVTK